MDGMIYGLFVVCGLVVYLLVSRMARGPRRLSKQADPVSRHRENPMFRRPPKR